MQSTAEITSEYIKEHPEIKSCLKKGLINYSSLARLIAKELNIEKKTSMEAILIAARRFQDKLKKESSYEKRIKDLLSKSEIDIKNKMVVYIIDKNIDFNNLLIIQKKIREDYGTFYLVEGSDSYTLIIQEKFLGLVKARVIKKTSDLVLISIKSSKEIEDMPGVLSYIISLFAENGVNIEEHLSCWTDTLFVIKSSDVDKAIRFLKF